MFRLNIDPIFKHGNPGISSNNLGLSPDGVQINFLDNVGYGKKHIFGSPNFESEKKIWPVYQRFEDYIKSFEIAGTKIWSEDHNPLIEIRLFGNPYEGSFNAAAFVFGDHTIEIDMYNNIFIKDFVGFVYSSRKLEDALSSSFKELYDVCCFGKFPETTNKVAKNDPFNYPH